MFNFYTVDEWEDYLIKVAPEALARRAEHTIELGWKSSYILIQVNDIEFDCKEWLEEHCEGGVWKKFSRQYEFQLKKDALLFKLVWTR